MSAEPQRKLSSWAWCVHYNGTFRNERCVAGVRYEDVKDRDVRPYRYPCFQDRLGSIPCPHQQFKTEEQIAAEEQEAAEHVRAYFTDLTSGTCPICKEPYSQRKQVGRCVYAEPCGHRLYQGKA